jgi:hypothetical protein
MPPRDSLSEIPNVPVSRRSFFKQCGFAAATAAGVSGGASLMEAGAVTMRLRTGSAELAVRDFALGYGNRLRITGASVLARTLGRTPRVTPVLVEVANLGAMQDALTGRKLPFHDVYAQGNTLSFTHEGTNFSIENLLPERFRQRMTALQSSRGVTFGHEAMIYNPDTSALLDPFHVAGIAQLRLVRPGNGFPAAFDTVLEGLLTAADFRLTPDAAFGRLRQRVLQVGNVRAAVAEKITRSLLQRLTMLADALPARQMTVLFRSPLVNASLASALGVSGEALAAKYAQRRGVTGPEFSDASVWLAVVLGPEIESDPVNAAATTLIQNGTRFDVLRSQTALGEARQLVALPAFARN